MFPTIETVITEGREQTPRIGAANALRGGVAQEVSHRIAFVYEGTDVAFWFGLCEGVSERCERDP